MLSIRKLLYVIALVTFFSLVLSACGGFVDAVLDPDSLVEEEWRSCVNEQLDAGFDSQTAEKNCLAVLPPGDYDTICNRVNAVGCPTGEQPAPESDSGSPVDQATEITEDSADQESENTSQAQLLFNGIYFKTFSDGWTWYIRLYEDGTAYLVASNNASLDEVAAWFTDGHEAPVLGGYEVSDNMIQIDFPSPEFSVQLNGEILGHGLNLVGEAGDVEPFSGLFEFTATE